MDVSVHSDFHNKALSSLRLPSFAGNGLPERMRTTAFAFLGMTAAAGLAFVAIFAQLGFPLLAPAPLPSDPARENAVAHAVALQAGRSDSAPTISAGDSATWGETGTGAGTAGGGGSGRNATPADSPPPAASPGEPASAGGGGSGAGAPAAQTPAPGSVPTGTPETQPVASPTPAAPGGSASSAAASHANPRGIEASSKTSGSKGPAGSKASSGSRKASRAAGSEPPPPSTEDASSQAATPHGKAKGHAR